MPANSILLTCSCSAHLDMEAFKNTIIYASINAKRQIQFLDILTFSPDHLELPSFTEGAYLKAIFVRVI